MTSLLSRLRARILELASVDGVVLQECVVRPGISPLELDELEEGLEVHFCPELRAFYEEIGGVSVAWSIDPASAAGSFSEEDLGYLAGGIGILDPFTLVMGRAGRRWKDEIWFDSMSDEERARFAAFVPFDFPTGEYAFGFEVTEGRIGPTMGAFDSSAGIVASEQVLDRYLEHLLETRGLFYAHDPDGLPTPDLVPRTLAFLDR